MGYGAPTSRERRLRDTEQVIREEFENLLATMPATRGELEEMERRLTKLIRDNADADSA